MLHNNTTYTPFGMLMPGRNWEDANTKYRIGFNGMEHDRNVKGKGNSYNYGARMYAPRLGRWLSIDAYALKYPFASPYNYALNTPIRAYDPDGKLVILINGKVGNDTERGSISYWSKRFVKRVTAAFRDKNTKFVDGDGANWPSDRKKSGYTQAQADYKDIIASLQKDETGKITETIKVISHSKGGAYADGYIEGLRAIISENQELFAGEGGKIELSIMLAPHQSGYIDVQKSETVTVAVTHDYDPLSDDGVTGDVISFSTDSDQWMGEVNDTHTIDGFHDETIAIINQFFDNKKNGRVKSFDDYTWKDVFSGSTGDWKYTGYKDAAEGAASNKLYNRDTDDYSEH